MQKGAKSANSASPKKSVKRQRRSTTVSHKQLNGGKFSPSTNPPDVTAQPWYPLNLSWTGYPGVTSFSTVIEKFRAQLDPNGHGLNPADFKTADAQAFRLQFRIKKVTVWNLTGKALSLTVYDDLEQNNTDKDQLGGWTDCGGVNCFPAIGFLYPYSHANRVHRPDKVLKDTVICQTTASGASDTILYHLSILWRFDGSVKAMSVIPSNEERLLRSIQNLANHIEGNQPSTIEKVVNGIKTTAAVVSVIAAEESPGPSAGIFSLPRQRPSPVETEPRSDLAARLARFVLDELGTPRSPGVEGVTPPSSEFSFGHGL